ncbi:MAG: radical SAM protein [Anaerolineae bacterium]|nr:radical SAM protein [Anaerolineae bacterium]
MPKSQLATARSVDARLAPPEIPEVVLPEFRDRFHLDVLLVNPPSPNKDPYIRDVHRVGRNSREGTIWPQTALAQLAAMFPEETSLRVIDCIAERMTWPEFQQLLLQVRPRYYITHATAPTITNDMRGVFLAKALGATTMAIGTHVSPTTVDTLKAYPALDFVLRGEPEETVRELVDTLEAIRQQAEIETDSGLLAPWFREPDALAQLRGIAYRRDGRVVVNPDRPFAEDLDSLPIPRHELLPLEKYKLPIVGGRYTFVVTSRGCPGGCRFCIKHVTYQNTFRFRSPGHILKEVRKLVELGTTNIHFEADLFTINRDQVAGLCNAILEQGPRIRWTCNSRVDFVDEELLNLMSRAGCWMISWGIESGSSDILKRVRKGIDLERVEEALRWSKAAGIRNWGYFILGLPGETEETIEQTIAFSKKLPLDLALFHIAVPYPGTPFWFEACEQGWLRVRRWEDFDMYNSTVVEYPNLTAEQLQKAARRAAREWSLRPGPIWTFLKEFRNRDTLGQLVRIGVNYLSWIGGRG